MEKYDVAIIGAGLGGLSAGLKLIKHDKRVVIFEKEDICGGRASSEKINGLIIDKGASYINSDKASIHKFITKFALNSHLVDCGKKFKFVNRDGIVSFNFNKNITDSIDKISNLAKENEKIQLKKTLLNFYLDIKNNYQKRTDYLISADRFLHKYFDDNIISNYFEPLSETFYFVPLTDIAASSFVVMLGKLLDPNVKFLYLYGGIGKLANKMELAIKKNQKSRFIFDEVINVDSVNDYFILKTSSKKSVMAEHIVSNIPIVCLSKIFPKIKNVVKTRFGDIKYSSCISTYITANNIGYNIDNQHAVFFGNKPDIEFVYVSDCSYKNKKVNTINKLVNIVWNQNFTKAHINMPPNLLNKHVRQAIDKSKIIQKYKIIKNIVWEFALPIPNNAYLRKANNNILTKNVYVCGDMIHIGLNGAIESGITVAKSIINTKM